MSQPKVEMKLFDTPVEGIFISLIQRSGDLDGYLIDICEAKTKKTAYKRAAAKLRKLADEAERLAEES